MTDSIYTKRYHAPYPAGIRPQGGSISHQTTAPDPIRSNSAEKAMAKILMAFWHRSRMEAVPLTRSEVLERVSSSSRSIQRYLSELRGLGLIVSKKHVDEGMNFTTYEPTERAAALIRRSVDANAGERRSA